MRHDDNSTRGTVGNSPNGSRVSRRTQIADIVPFGPELAEEQLRLVTGGIYRPKETYTHAATGSDAYDFDF